MTEVIVLDVRSVEAFAQGHIVRSGHIPARELEDRAFELPPKVRDNF